MTHSLLICECSKELLDSQLKDRQILGRVPSAKNDLELYDKVGTGGKDVCGGEEGGVELLSQKLCRAGNMCAGLYYLGRGWVGYKCTWNLVLGFCFDFCEMILGVFERKRSELSIFYFLVHIYLLFGRHWK